MADDDKKKRETRSTPPENDESLFDRVVPDGFRKGVETLLREGKVKSIVGDLKLPKEIVNHIMAQVDDTKRSALELVGRELRGFLEQTDLADELARLLTKISLEVKTEVRFVPREPDATLAVESTEEPDGDSEPPAEA